MKAEIRPSWMRMSLPKLERHLHETLYDPALIDDMVEQVRRAKAQERAQKIKGTVTHQMWDEVLKPARTEVATVRTLITQANKLGTPEAHIKVSALKLYAAVISETIEKLKRVQKAADLTPQKFAAELRKAGKLHTDGDGTHWADYIKRTDRRMVEAAFDKCEPPKRGRTKTPFARVIDPETHYRDKHAMGIRITREIQTLEQQVDMETFPDDRLKIEKKIDELYRAQYELERLPRTSPIPSTWHGLLK